MTLSVTTVIKSSSTVDTLSSKHHQQSQRQKNQQTTTGSTPSTPSKALTNSTVTFIPNSTRNSLLVDLAGGEDASVSKDSLPEMDKSVEPLLDVLIDTDLTKDILTGVDMAGGVAINENNFPGLVTKDSAI